MIFIKNKTSWFTLVELMIAMTIFGMMTIMVMSIYFSTTDTTRRLNYQRELAETAREITERVTADIKQYWLTWDLTFDTNYDLWKKYDYTGSGNEYLNLVNWRYVYGAKKPGGMDTCTGIRKLDPKIHCGLYFLDYIDNGANGYNLVDSFNPDESRKRVKVEDLKFYVSWDGISTSRKVLVNFTLSLMAKNGISQNLTNTTKLHIQTTISERNWKK
jgi:type II secretory pathway pseudopilin PulG